MVLCSCSGSRSVLPENEAWRPWTVGNVPAGYATTCSTAGQSKSPILATDDLFSRGGTLLPSIYAEARYSDDVIV